MENTDVTILNNKNNQEGSPGEVFLKSFKKYNRKKGIDGNLWIVNAVNGQKFWQKITNYKLIDVKSVNTLRSTKECKTKSYISKNNIKKKTYFTHANGDRPFYVYVDSNEINVFTYENYNYDDDDITDDIDNYNIQILTIKNMLGYWYGFDESYCNFHGNSLLVQLDSYNYVHIGSEIYGFETKDIIYDYYSEVGNSDVPYPIALGEENVYFMLDRDYLKNGYIPNSIPPSQLYGYYYGHIKVNDAPLIPHPKKDPNLTKTGKSKKQNSNANNSPRMIADPMLNVTVFQKRL